MANPHGHAFDLHLDTSGDPIHLVHPLALPFTGRPARQSRCHNGRHELRRLALDAHSCSLARLPTPREHLLRAKPMLASNVGNNRTSGKRLFNDTRLKAIGELPPPASPRYHLQPPNRSHLRLKLMVKRRHKPISNSEINTLDHHAAG